jgi:hypothetical protein
LGTIKIKGLRCFIREPLFFGIAIPAAPIVQPSPLPHCRVLEDPFVALIGVEWKKIQENH